MLESWIKYFAEEWPECGDLDLIRISVIESRLLAMWPFKNTILKSSSPFFEKYKIEFKNLYYFGNAKEIMQSLKITNRLTLYL